MDLTNNDKCLNAMPLHHIGGIAVHVMPTIISGGTVVCMERYAPASFAARLEIDDISWFSFVPTALAALAAHYDAVARVPTLKALRFVRNGGAKLTEDLETQLQRIFKVPVVQSYGMTESCGPCTQSKASDLKFGSCGAPIAACVAVLDPETYYPLPRGSDGLVAVGGQTIIEKYKNNTSSKSFIVLRPVHSIRGPKTFFLTGDTGKLLNDGQLRISGRIKEMIKRGGEQISPHEVEEVLRAHPQVETAYAFAIPSEIWGEEVGAAIILVSPQSSSSITDSIIESLKEHCQALPSFKQPRIYRFVDESDLPKTGSKKISRIRIASALNVSIAPRKHRLSPPKVCHGALSGLRYILALWVMFNHIGEGPLIFSNVSTSV